MDTAKINKIIESYNRDADCAIEMLLDIQDEFKHLPEDVVRYIADEIEVPLGQLYFVGTFYDVFTLEPSEDELPQKPIEAFMKQQNDKRIPSKPDAPSIVFRNMGNADAGEYKSFEKVLETMSPDDVISEVEKSGLLGRCGFGNPTADKWKACAKAVNDSSNPAYVICNADEGIPGAFAYKNIVESDPHSIIEGMLICAYAVGAKEGIIHIRNCYSQAIEQMAEAIEDARAKKLLGENIKGKDFSFDIKIRRGPGAYMNLDLSAMLESLQGKPAIPTASNVPLTEKGYKDMPTVLSCVETWMNVPVIIEKGGDAFKKIGNSGTKVVSLVGDIVNSGFVEVPLGITLRELIFDIGGGIPEGREFKAVQVGGPSGGCFPADMLDTPLDYAEIEKAGSIIGPGLIRVYDNSRCMVEAAKDSIEFLKSECFGKAAPDREGSVILFSILENISQGNGKKEDLDTLKSICETMSAASLSGLGKSAGNSILSTIKHFEDDYTGYFKN
ncbi:NAD(P)H-dependent oxidoreductase subunit E [bacterium]|nr:NAD(P)H-dependent oxidoreductase subunit E [bacterium]